MPDKKSKRQKAAGKPRTSKHVSKNKPVSSRSDPAIGSESCLLRCSFCGLNQLQVTKLIAGPGVAICDDCVEMALEIFKERSQEPAGSYSISQYLCSL